jgi:phosphate transport system substrate-binding protein
MKINENPHPRLFWTAKLLPLLLAPFLAGCPSKPDSAATTNTSPGSKIIIKGSNTVGEELAPMLVAQYKKDHPSQDIQIETKGSSSGFWGIIGGGCDIAASSREPLKDEQQQAEARGISLSDHVIGSYCVAIVVNSNNPVADLSKEQVRDIFDGSITNWKQVGGSEGAIHLYIRNPISGTYLGFRELAIEDKAYTTNNLVEYTNYTAIVQAIAKDPNGIGYAHFEAAKQPGVKATTIGGKTPTVASVNNHEYPYARVLHLYTDKVREGACADFLQFVISPKGQEIVQKAGFIPHP